MTKSVVPASAKLLRRAQPTACPNTLPGRHTAHDSSQRVLPPSPAAGRRCTSKTLAAAPPAPGQPPAVTRPQIRSSGTCARRQEAACAAEPPQTAANPFATPRSWGRLRAPHGHDRAAGVSRPARNSSQSRAASHGVARPEHIAPGKGLTTPADAADGMDVLASQVQQLQEQLALKEQENQQLVAQLQHLRTWMNALQQRARANDPHALLVARELYVGGVPEGTTEDDLCSFFNALMTCSGAQQDSGTSVVSCAITRDKGPPYAFIKLRSVQEASNALAFNGIQFRGSTLKVSRPSKYHPDWGVLLGPTNPDPTINTSMLSINSGSGDGTPLANGSSDAAPRKPANPNRLYISGLPYNWRTQHLQGMLSPFGELKDCVVIVDKMSQKSKGYGFCEFADGAVVGGVIKSLHNSMVEGRKITVKRADEDSTPSTSSS